MCHIQDWYYTKWVEPDSGVEMARGCLLTAGCDLYEILWTFRNVSSTQST